MESNNLRVLNNWAILCPGPSLRDHKRFEYSDGCDIAVNGAEVYKICNYWAVIDHEVYMNVVAKRSMSVRSTLWIPFAWAEHEEEWKLPNIYYTTRKAFWTKESISMSETDTLAWQEYTMFSAIALAVKMGAEVIRMYGMDLAGSGYFMDGLNNNRTRHIDKRWKDELDKYHLIEEYLKNRGIELIRIYPACPKSQ